MVNRLESYFPIDKYIADKKLNQAIDYCRDSIVSLANLGGISGEEYYYAMVPIRNNFQNLFEIIKYHSKASENVGKEFFRVFQDLCFIMNPSNPRDILSREH